MRLSFRSVLILVAIACLLVPAVLMAGDSSAAATAQPGSAAAAAAQPANSAAAPATAPAASGANISPALSPSLVDLLVKKGVLTTAEANSLRTVSGGAGMEQLLLLLKAKGVVDESDVAELKTAAAEAEADHAMMDTVSGEENATLTTQAVQEKKPEAVAGPTVVPAIAPVRVLPVGPPVKEGLKPALKIGGVSVTPMGSSSRRQLMTPVIRAAMTLSFPDF